VIGAGLAAGLIVGRILRGGAEAAARESDGGPGSYAGGGYAGGGYARGSYAGSGYAGTGSTYRGSGVASTDDVTVGAGGIDTVTSGDTVEEDLFMTDSATGDAVRDEAPAARTRTRSRS
jgi:hypothetical protein